VKASVKLLSYLANIVQNLENLLVAVDACIRKNILLGSKFSIFIALHNFLLLFKLSNFVIVGLLSSFRDSCLFSSLILMLLGLLLIRLHGAQESMTDISDQSLWP